MSSDTPRVDEVPGDQPHKLFVLASQLERELTDEIFSHAATHQELTAAQSALASKEAELSALRAEIKEWVCEDCNRVYPGPPQPGFMCLMCPDCGGSTMPMALCERRKLRAELLESRAKFDQLSGRYEDTVAELEACRQDAVSLLKISFETGHTVSQEAADDLVAQFDAMKGGEQG